MDETQSNDSSWGWKRHCAMWGGLALTMLETDWSTMIGVTLILLALFWSWKIGRFPMGRVVAMSLVILITMSSQFKEPEPIETVNPRGKASSLGNVDFNIYGVKPGMNFDQVEALLGEADEDGDGDTFMDGRVKVNYNSAREVRSVEGDQLFDGENVFLKSGSSKQKLKAIFGNTGWGRDGTLCYSVVDPDLEVKMSGDLIRTLTLTK